MLASRTNENAESARPNSSARLGAHAAGRDRAALRPLAHQRVDVAVEHVVERARAAAREREAGHRRDRRSAVPGQPRAPAIIPQKPVTSSSDMIRGFVSVT